MSTRFRIPRVLARCCDDHDELQLDGETVGELLRQLQRQYPALHRCLCNETGAVRQHIHLFLNDDFVCKPHGLETRLNAGDVVSVFQAVSGG